MSPACKPQTALRCAPIRARGLIRRSIRESRVEPVVVAGAAAAYGLVRFGVDTVSASVVVRRLSDGRRLSGFAVTRSAVPEGVEPGWRVR